MKRLVLAVVCLLGFAPSVAHADPQWLWGTWARDDGLPGRVWYSQGYWDGATWRGTYRDYVLNVNGSYVLAPDGTLAETAFGIGITEQVQFQDPNHMVKSGSIFGTMHWGRQ